MDDAPVAIADRLTQYVNELLEARQQRNVSAVRGRTQLVLRVLEKLRQANDESPLPAKIIGLIDQEKARAEVDLPTNSPGYENVCRECWGKGRAVIVDKRIDEVCPTCGWVRCPECGVCRGPKSGGCPSRPAATKRPRSTARAASSRGASPLA